MMNGKYLLINGVGLKLFLELNNTVFAPYLIAIYKSVKVNRVIVLREIISLKISLRYIRIII